MSKEDLIKDFDDAMMNIYRRAWNEAGYKATRYHQMLIDHGGLETARILLRSSTVSEGYTALWERKRLDLTVEAMIMENAKYHSLFTGEELGFCRQRLSEYNYKNK